MSFQHLAAEWRLTCGPDSLVALARELDRQGCRRAVLVCGPSVGSTPAMDLLRDALGARLVGESRAVRANSPLAVVVQVAQQLGELAADAVVAVGGGSAAVTARAAAILLAEGRPAHELATRRLPDGRFHSPRLQAPKLPQFVVPTTPSTAFVKAGSAVHDGDDGERLALFDPKTRVRALFVHPAFLHTAPAELVRSASLNTVSNAVEALESPRCDPIAEGQLLQALRLTAPHLRPAPADDEHARQQLVLAALLCGRGSESVGSGLSSVLAHAIGQQARVANGIVNAIVLPHTMRFNAAAARPGAARLAASLLTGGELPGTASTDAAIDALAALLATLPIPRQLRAIGVRQDQLEAIATAAMTDWFITRNPRTVTGIGELRALLDAAW